MSAAARRGCFRAFQVMGQAATGAEIAAMSGCRSRDSNLRRADCDGRRKGAPRPSYRQTRRLMGTRLVTSVTSPRDRIPRAVSPGDPHASYGDCGHVLSLPRQAVANIGDAAASGVSPRPIVSGLVQPPPPARHARLRLAPTGCTAASRTLRDEPVAPGAVERAIVRAYRRQARFVLRATAGCPAAALRRPRLGASHIGRWPAPCNFTLRTVVGRCAGRATRRSCSGHASVTGTRICSIRVKRPARIAWLTASKPGASA